MAGGCTEVMQDPSPPPAIAGSHPNWDGGKAARLDLAIPTVGHPSPCVGWGPGEGEAVIPAAEGRGGPRGPGPAEETACR